MDGQGKGEGDELSVGLACLPTVEFFPSARVKCCKTYEPFLG